MGRNKKSLPGAKPDGIKQDCADRAKDQARLQFSLPFKDFKTFDTYRCNVRKMIADAFVMSREFPSRLRFSYYVDRNGSLRYLTEWRAGQ